MFTLKWVFMFCIGFIIGLLCLNNLSVLRHKNKDETKAEAENKDETKAEAENKDDKL